MYYQKRPCTPQKLNQSVVYRPQKGRVSNHWDTSLKVHLAMRACNTVSPYYSDHTCTLQKSSYQGSCTHILTSGSATYVGHSFISFPKQGVQDTYTLFSLHDCGSFTYQTQRSLQGALFTRWALFGITHGKFNTWMPH